ncbi:hypothetical protein KL86APRO_20570 [uncultured Alphaproteobacteria bacterium]|uniref:Uncharacterized protein n=1 Tax=uncultured Alphaproteobacteria bacterium TaxID=91750 RepID=A0A212KKV6_9PROT|nr:hypothetical protein KL86APRO_20570 [uncultured Alphaproteobacteria bacterium]
MKIIHNYSADIFYLGESFNHLNVCRSARTQDCNRSGEPEIGQNLCDRSGFSDPRWAFDN